MRKRTAQPTRAGQLAGTQLRIVTIHNDGLRESITLANQGTLAQPMCGWAREQMWNNRGDVAVLFDSNGLEVDRYTYPHKRILGSAVQHRKQLVRDSGTWWMVDEL